MIQERPFDRPPLQLRSLLGDRALATIFDVHRIKVEVPKAVNDH